MSSNFINLNVRISLDNNDNDDHKIDPYKICKHIQEYLDSNVSYYDKNSQLYEDARVVGYKLEFDSFNPISFVDEDDPCW
tara:strand:- start:2401 stop:2640 length:240 start_codon:yes stop_codon:yes gene_type:complete